ncbi:MAG: PD-(D/E)XK nuclease family protein [Patescibacteria group bacterium]|nr:PD-(D/E)XK nuclease family protein [Patescibacteria group bacterium]
MAEYYKAKRSYGIFDPKSNQPYKLSRSKLDLFLNCPRCFYLDRRLGVGQPSMPAFTLNVAVDALLKKEFDVHRARQTTHPLMAKYGLKAVPFMHPNMGQWRENFVGVQFLHKPTNFLVFGAVDDIWQTPDGVLHVVDYKATSKDGEVELENTKWHNQYRRQMEVYQWLLRQNGFEVSDTGYFVYVNARKDKQAFDGQLEFKVKIIPYTGQGNWVEKQLTQARKCLMSGTMPPAAAACEFCAYRQAAYEQEHKPAPAAATPAAKKKKAAAQSARLF